MLACFSVAVVTVLLVFAAVVGFKILFKNDKPRKEK